MQGALEELQAVRKYEIYQAEYEDDLANKSVSNKISQMSKIINQKIIKIGKSTRNMRLIIPNF